MRVRAVGNHAARPICRSCLLLLKKVKSYIINLELHKEAFVMSIIEWLRSILLRVGQHTNSGESSCQKTDTFITETVSHIEPQKSLNCNLQEKGDTFAPVTQTASKSLFNNLVESFLEQFQFDPEFECPFIYHEGSLQTFQCVLVVSKLALRHQQVKNLFPDDDTVVYFTTIPRDNPALISFMQFALKKAMCIESFSIFGSNGKAILEELSNITTSKEKVYSQETRIFQEQALQYSSHLEFKKLIKKLYEFFCTKFYAPEKLQYAYVNAEFNLNIYQKLCNILNVDSSTSVRWKNEYHLYNLIKKHYSDAVYQFRATWLGAQSLDIFIPSLNVGIEYQGIQHYESVSLFGGEDALHTRKSNDEKKRAKCKENNVILIEWPYTDEVSEGNLQRKFKDLNFIIPCTKDFIISKEASVPEIDALNFLDEALSNSNLAKLLYNIGEMSRENNLDGIRMALCDVILNFSEYRVLYFFKRVLQYDSPAIYHAICSDKNLLEYWVNTGILNFYGRKIVFTLENRCPGSDHAAKYLRRMRKIEKEKGINPDVRGMNSLIRSEAADNGITEDRIRAILSKSY